MLTESAALAEVELLVSRLKERQQLRGMSGELMKMASCSLVDNCSRSKLPFHGKPVICEFFQCKANLNIKRKNFNLWKCLTFCFICFKRKNFNIWPSVSFAICKTNSVSYQCPVKIVFANTALSSVFFSPDKAMRMMFN